MRENGKQHAARSAAPAAPAAGRVSVVPLKKRWTIAIAHLNVTKKDWCREQGVSDQYVWRLFNRTDLYPGPRLLKAILDTIAAGEKIADRERDERASVASIMVGANGR